MASRQLLACTSQCAAPGRPAAPRAATSSGSHSAPFLKGSAENGVDGFAVSGLRPQPPGLARALSRRWPSWWRGRCRWSGEGLPGRGGASEQPPPLPRVQPARGDRDEHVLDPRVVQQPLARGLAVVAGQVVGDDHVVPDRVRLLDQAQEPLVVHAVARGDGAGDHSTTVDVRSTATALADGARVAPWVNAGGKTGKLRNGIPTPPEIVDLPHVLRHRSVPGRTTTLLERRFPTGGAARHWSARVRSDGGHGW